MAENPLLRLAELGQSVWYDNIHRGMLPETLQRMAASDGLRGVTSNPVIFQKAICDGQAYDAAIRDALAATGAGDPEALFEHLAVADIQAAADVLRPVYEAEGGQDGFVSLELSPECAHDAAGSVSEGLRLQRRVDRPNAMIKVPATEAGLSAVEELTAQGVPVNVTLIFGVARYRQAAAAYQRGLQRRLAAGEPVTTPVSVASLFVSRLDAKVDAQLAAAGAPEALYGRAAIANARCAYAAYREAFHGEAFGELRAAGAQPQRLLWASTGVKGERYPETYYVDALAGPETVTTLPPATYEAYRRDGAPAPRLLEGLDEAPAELERLREAGVDLEGALEALEAEGVEAFVQAHRQLLAALEEKARALATA
mgnify:CR=1 FL=1